MSRPDVCKVWPNASLSYTKWGWNRAIKDSHTKVTALHQGTYLVLIAGCYMTRGQKSRGVCFLCEKYTKEGSKELEG